MSFCQLAHSKKFRPVLRNLCALPLFAGLLSGVGFVSPLAGAVVAQVIVQSTKDAGEIKLTATAAGLTPVTATVNMQHAKPRPLVP